MYTYKPTYMYEVAVHIDWHVRCHCFDHRIHVEWSEDLWRHPPASHLWERRLWLSWPYVPRTKRKRFGLNNLTTIPYTILHTKPWLLGTPVHNITSWVCAVSVYSLVSVSCFYPIAPLQRIYIEEMRASLSLPCAQYYRFYVVADHKFCFEHCRIWCC